MLVLETARLLIRPFTMQDLAGIHRLLDVELAPGDLPGEPAASLAERARWLQWTVLSQEQLAALHQPPYGDRAAVLKATGQLVGACGFVPCLGPFEQLPGLRPPGNAAGPARNTAEVGLYYATAPAFRRRGYATEAARRLVDYAFAELRLKRVIATTTHGNEASTAVMGRLGMRIERNPLPEPAWLQVVGVLDAAAPSEGAKDVIS